MFVPLRLTVWVSAGHLVREENSGRHPGENHDEERQQLQVPGQDAGALGVTEMIVSTGNPAELLVTSCLYWPGPSVQ